MVKFAASLKSLPQNLQYQYDGLYKKHSFNQLYFWQNYIHKGMCCVQRSHTFYTCLKPSWRSPKRNRKEKIINIFIVFVLPKYFLTPRKMKPAVKSRRPVPQKAVVQLSFALVCCQEQNSRIIVTVLLSLNTSLQLHLKTGCTYWALSIQNAHLTKTPHCQYTITATANREHACALWQLLICSPKGSRAKLL